MTYIWPPGVFIIISKFDNMQRWARYSIFELIDIDTRYLIIELIDSDTRYFEEVVYQYRYRDLYRRYKYLNTMSGKKINQKNWFTNELKKLPQVCYLQTIAKRKNITHFFFICSIFILSRESDQCATQAHLGVASHLSTIPRWGNPAKCLFQWHNY